MFSSLFVVAVVALVAPMLSDAIPHRAVPATVMLLLAGSLLGPHGAELIAVGEGVRAISELGLCFLFLLAGFDVDATHVVGRVGRYGAVTWMVTFGIALGASLAVPAVGDAAVPVAIALTTTAIGTLLPILSEKGMVGTPVGNAIVSFGTWGELGPVIAMAALLSGRSGAATLLVLSALAVACILAAKLPALAMREGSRFLAFVERHSGGGSQALVRLVMVMLTGLVALAGAFGVDVVLGAFTAGFCLRHALPDGHGELDGKLEGIAHGVLVPAFFVVSGCGIDLAAVSSEPLLLGGFVLALLAVRAVPVFVGTTICPDTRPLPTGSRVGIALWCSAALPLVVAVTSVAVSAGTMSQGTASVLVAAGAVSVLVMPLVGHAVMASGISGTKGEAVIPEADELDGSHGGL